ncbi:hypothetical protein M0R72_17200 [Candidatus Pacearchaeota archaeon]|nr:hypothetical protein [Candidatus Pacearchaeota archaeon]
MLVSEQAPAQDVLADHTPGASTFPGTPTSGGWIPILSQPKEGGRPFISDWICPSCKRLTSQSSSCPHCGLRIKETPRIKPKEPFSKGKRIYQYRDWEEAEYAGPKKQAGFYSIRPQLRKPP